MMRLKTTTAVLLFALTANIFTISAQDNVKPITTAVPFLNISPESRSGGMGDAGVASSPDVNSQHINPAKYAFIEGQMGVGISFTPWLRKLVNDINLSYVSFYHRLDKMQTVSASLRYFSLGEITYQSSENATPYTAKPNEFAIDAAYARVLSDNISGAVAFRYIRSDFNSTEENLVAGNAFAADIAFYYHNKVKINKRKAEYSAGLNITNIGSTISYDDGATKQAIPTNLKIGGGFSTEIDRYNSVGFVVDFNKLLVPTPQPDDTGSEEPSMAGLFSSFNDAPGGFEEELQEVMVSIGGEYWYNKQFAIRAGYNHQNENKGNLKYATAGIGIKFNSFALDASYIIPVVQDNPLANTVRFSLLFDLGNLK